jgi:ABC-type transporter Mla subunit MlaD
MLGDIQPAIDNLNKVAQDLADADIDGMLSDVDKLVTSSEKNLGDALKTITEIDIKSLNESIADLNAVVKPLAGMFRR